MFSLGIDLGGTYIKAGIVDDDGNIVAQDTCKTLAKRPPEEIMRDAAQMSLCLCENLRISSENLRNIGIGTPGLIDRKHCKIIYSANLNFKNIDIIDCFKHYFPFNNMPIFLENDAYCAALAESEAGAAKQYQNSITVTLGTGVGAGIIIKRKLFFGYNGLSPEIGHMIIQTDGIPCSCGRKGCMERYISASALIEQATQAAKKNPQSILNNEKFSNSASGAFEASRQGDITACKVIDRYLHYLAISLSNLFYAFGPEIILLGGGICNEGDELLTPLRKKLRNVLTLDSHKTYRVDLATFKNNAGIIGASMLRI